MNETIFINLYLNNNFVYTVTTAASTFQSFNNINVSNIFLKVGYQNNPNINNAIRNNIINEGLTIPFEYVTNISFNDSANVGAHTVSFSLRVYSLIGNKLRSFYLIPSSLNATGANTDSPIGIARLTAASSVEFSIDSNIITKYDNYRNENLIYCRLTNKYWSTSLQDNNFFLPIHFFNLDNENDNLNEGLNISSDTQFGFTCEAATNLVPVSYDCFLIGVKNLVISRNGVAVV